MSNTDTASTTLTNPKSEDEGEGNKPSSRQNERGSKDAELDTPDDLKPWQHAKLDKNDQDAIETQLVLSVIPTGLTENQAKILLNLTFDYTQEETAKSVGVSRVYVKDIAYRFSDDLAELRSRKKLILKAFSECNMFRTMKLLSDSLALAKPDGEIKSIQQLSNALNTLMLTHERLVLTDQQVRTKMKKREGQTIAAKTMKALDALGPLAAQATK